MSCKSEHDEHHDHHHHGHDHSKDIELERGQEFSLYKYIDTSKVFCLNERARGSAVNVFKSWHDRLDKSKKLESDDDEELIIHIPFTGGIKLKSIMIIGGDGGSSPAKMKVFTNRNDVDFTNANQIPAIQEWDLHEDFKGVNEYPTRIAKFNNVSDLTIYFPRNFGADTTTVYYIGLKGDFTELKREAVIATYESKPQLKDHKAKEEFGAARQIQ